MAIKDLFERIKKPSVTDTMSINVQSSGGLGYRTPTYLPSSMADNIYNRIAVDVSSIVFQHVKVVTESGNITDIIPQDSSLNNCLSVEANIDQSHTELIRDIVLTMCHEGCAVLVPTVTEEVAIKDPTFNIYSIKEMRVGVATDWYVDKVKVRLFNHHTGRKEEIVLSKKYVAIIENPFRSTMATNTAAASRLNEALSLSKKIDAIQTDRRLNMMVTVPYALGHESMKVKAEAQLQSIKEQLSADDGLGIAMLGNTDKITQLNRPLTSNIEERINKLEKAWYNQQGLTQEIFDGTFDSNQYQNYFARTLQPMATAIVDAMNRKFLTKTARTQGHRIEYYNDLFRFIPIEKVAEIGDSMLRNTIMTPNEFRRVLRLSPSTDGRANSLINPNMPDDKQLTEENPGADFEQY